MILTVTANPTIDRVYFVEQFTMGEVHRPQRYTCTAGGKGLNVARVAKTLGTEAIAMGFVGGYNGAFIKEETKKLGILPAFTDIAGETRTCVNVTDACGQSGEILEGGPTVSPSECDTLLSEFEKLIQGCKVIAVSGSLPKGLDGAFYCELIRIAKKSNIKIIVDTCGGALEKVIDVKPYMVKPNAFELSNLFGNEIHDLDGVKNALTVLRQKGVEFPLISLGKDGAMALIDGKFYKYSTPRVKVVNAVGSGDSTVAGVAVGIDRGMPISDAIRLGMAAGTANTQFEATGMVTAALVGDFYNQITVEEG